MNLVNDLIHQTLQPGYGGQATLTQERKAYVDQYAKEVVKLDDKDMVMIFHSVINYSGACGYERPYHKEAIVQHTTAWLVWQPDQVFHLDALK